ncbi:hypothetical protein TSMEX_007884 [Taenia solium]|eukprot:TsM_000185300 transcript=TsM_000185300 gene=TsM_000185300
MKCHKILLSRGLQQQTNSLAKPAPNVVLNTSQLPHAATESSPYKVQEYYGFSQYSFVDLGAKKQSLRNPQPSNKS